MHPLKTRYCRPAVMLALRSIAEIVHLSRTSPCVKDPAAEPLVLPPDLVSLVHESARIDPEFCEQREDEAVQLLETFVCLVNEMEGRQQNLFAA